MINVNKLKGIIVERGLSQRKVAAKMGVSETTFYNKMHAGVFDSTEISFLIDFLKIDNPMDVFFVQNVASEATKAMDDNEVI